MLGSVKTLHRQTSRIGKRNQVTIPADVLRALGVGPGDTVEVEVRRANSDRREMTDEEAAAAVEGAFGALWRPGMPVLEIDELEEVIAQAAEDAAIARCRRSFESPTKSLWTTSSRPDAPAAPTGYTRRTNPSPRRCRRLKAEPYESRCLLPDW
jgi:AbrB family looped-hinge helix DNA binding protein